MVEVYFSFVQLLLGLLEEVEDVSQMDLCEIVGHQEEGGEEVEEEEMMQEDVWKEQDQEEPSLEPSQGVLLER